jgi:tyrosine-protein phosphatase YwqE
MHSHLIPGIDDGSATIEDSINMIRRLIALGYEKIITTPHIMGEYYPNTPKIIRAGLFDLKNALSEASINIKVEAAAEYYVDDYFETLLNENTELLSFSGNHLLIEFSTLYEPANALDVIFQLKGRGFQPILAHPERYIYLANQFEQFEKIKSLGCSLQVNLLSLAGYYGREQKRLGIKLLSAGMVDYLGTDLHRESQVEKLITFSDRKISKLLRKYKFKNIDL